MDNEVSAKKILLVFAHPDDESFAAAGTIAKYVQSGWRVDLVCATRGEAGESGPYNPVSEERLGQIRQKETEKAGTTLGISSVTFLGYSDGALAQENPGELEDKLYQIMTEHIPDIVMTFDTTGISNHPDHIKICFATTYVFQRYAFFIEEKMRKSLEYATLNAAPKLYYACMPESITYYLKKKKIIPDIAFDKPWEGTKDKYITTVINLKGFRMMKKNALLAHASQREDITRFLSLKNNPLLSKEYFILRMHGTKEVFMGKEDSIASKL